MGLQSVVFYVSVTWIPEILTGEGLSPAGAGWMVSIMQFVSIPAALTAPVIAERMSSQRVALVCAAALSGSGILCLLVLPGGGVLAGVVLLGLGQGSCISLALTLFALRSPDPDRTAELSSMAQSVGYLLGAAGPFTFGLLRDVSGSWSPPLIALLAVTGVLAAAGAGAGRDSEVPARDRRPEGQA